MKSSCYFREDIFQKPRLILEKCKGMLELHAHSLEFFKPCSLFKWIIFRAHHQHTNTQETGTSMGVLEYKAVNTKMSCQASPARLPENESTVWNLWRLSSGLRIRCTGVISRLVSSFENDQFSRLDQLNILNIIFHHSYCTSILLCKMFVQILQLAWPHKGQHLSSIHMLSFSKLVN